MTDRRLCDYRLVESLERTCRVVGNSHAYLLAIVGDRICTEIEEILVITVDFLLLYSGSPCVAVSPWHLIRCSVESDALILPVLQVGRRVAGIVGAAPTGITVGGGVDVIFA